MGGPADIRLCVLAAWAVCGLDRPAFLRARGEQSAAAGLVRAHRPSRRSRSLLPLCFFQYRQFSRALVLSRAAGADVHVARAGPVMDRRVWAVDRADRRLRRAPAAFAGARSGRSRDRGDNRSTTTLAA